MRVCLVAGMPRVHRYPFDGPGHKGAMSDESGRRSIAKRPKEPRSIASLGLLVFSIVLMTVATAIGTRTRATEAQENSLDTAAFAPDTALLYAAVNLDQSSDQYIQATALLDRAGLTGLLEQTVGGAMSDSGMDDILDAFLGGEVGFVVNDVSGAEGHRFRLRRRRRC